MNRGMSPTTVLAAALLGALAATGAAAEELKTPIRATMFLDLTAPRAQSRDTAYQESLRADGPAPLRRGLGEVQEDGSVRYGDVSVTVRNPCPPGTAHYDPTPLPGRRSK